MPVGLQIPVPAYRLARFHRQAEVIVGEMALGFSATELCDIDAGADVPSERSVGIEQRRGVLHKCPVFAALAAAPKVHNERFTTIEGTTVRVDTMLKIFAVYAFRPAIPDLEFEGASRKIEP